MNLNGQTRIVTGRVLSEELEPLPMLKIKNSDSVLLGKTDFNGHFNIILSREDETLLFDYLGMEHAEIKLNSACDTVELIIMNYVLYHGITSRKIDRLRKKRFDNILNLHSDAVKNGLFEKKYICYRRDFKAHKPRLDRIGRELKEFKKSNINEFKGLVEGDVVKIPFGLDSSEKSINTYYSPCENCTEEDYDYVIEGEILSKNRRKLTLEIKITEMQHYDSLEYRGKHLSIGHNFKYEMKYFEVITDK